MKTITPSSNAQRFPRCKVNEVECRERDLVIRISNWLDDRDEPGVDVECVIGGIYDWNESQSFTLESGLSKLEAKIRAMVFAQEQIKNLFCPPPKKRTVR